MKKAVKILLGVLVVGGLVFAAQQLGMQDQAAPIILNAYDPGGGGS